ncbi:interleukin-1 beta-like [Heptranchias perlo]|uniref:interleukin-1 beta-like n=1 Tax=Heptranchias perlo TaxID=212740 RepID=UPI0035599568
MRTEAGPMTTPIVESETLRTSSHRHRRDSCLTSPTSCPLVKSPFKEVLPNLMEASTARRRSDRESNQLKNTGRSSSITAAGNATLSLEKAVILVLAVKKFKKKLEQSSDDGWEHDGTSFEDADLLGSFDALVEEAITCISYDDTEEASSSYRFMRSECQKLRDEQGRSLMLSENLKLLAMFLQKPKDKLRLDVRYYKATVNEDNYLPVVLGINGRNMFLSCTGPHDGPRLQVEKWDKTLQNISSATDLLRFVFFKKVWSAGMGFEFESAMHRGWYICTAQKNKQPVKMDTKGITIFTDE